MILALGVYVAYTGLLKRETTKAVRAVINFVMIFLLSGSFIAYAPTYITKSMILAQMSAKRLLALEPRLSCRIQKAKERTVWI